MLRRLVRPDDPKATLKQLIRHIADGDGQAACRLFLAGAQATFASEHGAKDRTTAMDIVSGKVTDAKAYAAAEPAG